MSALIWYLPFVYFPNEMNRFPSFLAASPTPFLRLLVHPLTLTSIIELFDPTPFQSTFQSTVEKLLDLRNSVDKQITTLAKNCVTYDRYHDRL